MPSRFYGDQKAPLDLFERLRALVGDPNGPGTKINENVAKITYCVEISLFDYIWCRFVRSA
jgi:hypothetical protein